MKRIISVIMCSVMLLTFAVPALSAADSTEVLRAINALGIMSGDENGNMNLTREVTRAQFAKMLIMASEYKDTVQEGSNSSPFKDVKHTHWAADYIKTAVGAKWVTGYVDGTFRPDNPVTYEEAASAVLKLLGYESSDLTGTYPQAQFSKFRALKLDNGISPSQGKALTRNECMFIFYNLMGAVTKTGSVYGTVMGYPMNPDGTLDYDEYVKRDIKGPYIMRDNNLAGILPFAPEQASVYRNNSLSSSRAVIKNDVVYYNEKTKTVWVYSGHIIGALSAVSPDAVSPSSVTVAGVGYSLGTSQAKNKVAATGVFAKGDLVALLLGMSGEVVDIIPASELDGTYYGVVTKSTASAYIGENAESITGYVLSVACTDGITREFTVSADAAAVGSVVAVKYVNGTQTVAGASVTRLSGRFGPDGKTLGSYKLAGNAEIMDVSKDGGWITVYPSRLAGYTLEEKDVRFYSLNSEGEIERLIISDVTGDLYKYGIITYVQESQTDFSAGGSINMSGSYRYIIDGASGSLNTSDTIYRISRGPALFYYKNGQINGMKNLSAVSLTSISALTAESGGKTYKLADNVQVYLQTGSSDYVLTELSAVNSGDYKLTGYYEEIYTAGGVLRIVTASK